MSYYFFLKNNLGAGSKRFSTQQVFWPVLIKKGEDQLVLKRFSRETGNRPPDVASHSLHVYFGGLLVVGWIRRGHFLSIRVICGGLELTILLLETFLSGRTRIALPELLAAALADYRELFVRVKFLEIALRAVDVHNLIGEELIDFMYISPEYDTLSQQKSHGSLSDHG